MSCGSFILDAACQKNGERECTDDHCIENGRMPFPAASADRPNLLLSSWFRLLDKHPDLIKELAV